MIKPKTLKGFRDFLPNDVRKREYVIDVLKSVFNSYGFEPLETPSLEYEDVLLGKYGEEGDKLMYRFEDLGKRRVALRYDQTVPLARVVAQYSDKLPMPFKRYQIQNVWRAENTQRGRFREFLQCDADIVGSPSPLSDAEIILVAVENLKKFKFSNFKVLINDRELLRASAASVVMQIPKGANPQKLKEWDLAIITAVDKLKKVQKDEVISEITNKTPYSRKQARKWIDEITGQHPSGRLITVFKTLENFGLSKENVEFSPLLARGLDYYTGLIFEIEVQGYTAGSIAGGGRYDNLIGVFTGKKIPAVGFSFGFDRLIEAMEQMKLFPIDVIKSNTKVLVTIFSPKSKEKSLAIYAKIKNKNISCEIYLDENVSLEKQLKYADKKGIPFVVIFDGGNLILKNMERRTQENLSLKEILQKLSG